VTATEIVAAIQYFPVWHYEFELNGHKTPIFQADHVNRHAQRWEYFFQPLVELLGGSLRGKRVLDLGCNAGFWSLCAVEAGCDFVLGIDGRQMHIDQANFVFQTKGIEPTLYEFRLADIFSELGQDIGKFDVVLCLGLMYHVSKHVNLLELISRVNTDLLVIDTALSGRAGSILEVLHDPLENPRSACDYELVMQPTRAALLAMVRQFGYQAVTLQPNFSSYEGAGDFRTGHRRAFLCSKHTPLEGLRVEPEVQLQGNGTYQDLVAQVPGSVLLKAFFAKLFKRLGSLIRPSRGA
jgi:SAM-dependent methyltransferase